MEEIRFFPFGDKRKESPFIVRQRLFFVIERDIGGPNVRKRLMHISLMMMNYWSSYSLNFANIENMFKIRLFC